MILVVVEHEAGTVDRLSSEALTLGRALAETTGGPLQAVVWGPGAGAAAASLGAAGVAAVHEIADPRLTDYAPEALGKALAQLIERDAPAAVIGTGSERGAEVLAHAAARLGVPLAANVTEVRPGEPWQVTRQRWGGSLLEEARLDGPVRLLTVAPHAFAPASASGGRRTRDGPVIRPGPRPTATSGSGSRRTSPPKRGRSRSPTRASSSVVVAASAAPKASPSSTNSPRCWAARWASRVS